MNIFADKSKKLILGRQGENLVTTIMFPIEKWVSEFGEGTFALVHQRSGDTAAYPCTTTRSGNEILWSVSSADVRDIGDGRAQLSLTIGSKIAKSEVFHTSTLRSLDATANPPSAWQAWVDQVLAAGTAATTAVSHYPRINSSNNHWEVWSNNTWTDTGVIAKGSTPVITSSKTGNTTTVKADGTTIATLLDGTNGTDGHTPSITASKVNGVTTVSVDGSAVATINDGADGAVQDVKFNGTSVVTDGIANIPIEEIGDFETIFDVTMEEESVFSADNIDLAEAYVMVIMPTDTTRSINMYCYYGNTIIGSAYVGSLGGPTNKWYAHWFTLNKLWISTNTAKASGNYAQLYENMPFADNYRRLVTDYPVIKKIKTGSAVPVGTQIVCYGRR